MCILAMLTRAEREKQGLTLSPPNESEGATHIASGRCGHLPCTESRLHHPSCMREDRRAGFADEGAKSDVAALGDIDGH